MTHWKPRDTTRARGRPPTSWVDDIPKGWHQLAQNRDDWKRLEEAYIAVDTERLRKNILKFNSVPNWRYKRNLRKRTNPLIFNVNLLDEN